MPNINYARGTIAGRMTTDAELKTTPSGITVTNFTVAVKTGDNSSFFDITAWKTTAENISKFFKKGSSILLDVSLSTRTWEDKDGKKRKEAVYTAERFYFVDSKGDTGDSTYGGSNNTPAQSTSQKDGLNQGTGYQEPKFEAIGIDDDLPF